MSLFAALLTLAFVGSALSATLPELSNNVVFKVNGIGTVTGVKKSTADESKPMYCFYGLPFAEDTSGKHRFKHSIMKKYHNENYNLTVPDASQMCPQSAGGTEDCLKLYIYTTKEATDPDFGKLPVMVWIHGGSFMMGDFRSYSGELLLAQQDMVIVVPHYRLGVLGFMSLDTREAPGNAGLSDQVLALEWVQRYIRYFGGDPNHVVLAGESAGAGSVSHLMLYDGAKDLFHGVISQSGSSMDPWALDPTPVQSALSYGREYFGCDGDKGLDAFVECMREQSAEELANNWRSMQATMQFNGLTGFSGITPVIQKPGTAEKIIISDLPFKKMADKNFNPVPILYGSNFNEGSLVLMMMSMGYLKPHDVTHEKQFWQNAAWAIFMKVANIDDPTGSLKNALEDKYFKKIDFTNFNESVYGLIDMLGVLFFKAGAHQTVQLVDRAGADAYLYSFEFDAVGLVIEFIENFLNIELPQMEIPIGVFHAMELPYIWPTAPLIGEMKPMSTKMTTMWTNFIKYLNPTPLLQIEALSEAGIPIWSPYSQKKQSYLCIDKKLKLKEDFTKTWTGMAKKYLKEAPESNAGDVE